MRHKNIIACYSCLSGYPVLSLSDVSKIWRLHLLQLVVSWSTQLSPEWNQCCQIVFHYIPQNPRAICNFDSQLAQATTIFCFHYAAVGQSGCKHCRMSLSVPATLAPSQLLLETGFAPQARALSLIASHAYIHRDKLQNKVKNSEMATLMNTK